MSTDFQTLRLRRLKHRISRRELAQRLSCKEGWLLQLELHGYNGPAAAKWMQRYEEALSALIEAKKARG
jgi:transcriptional regulator with XRE-family HTH domain